MVQAFLTSSKMIFKSRREAGKRLLKELRHLESRDPIVVGIARGGIPVAYEIAYGLGSELTVLVTEKLQSPDEPNKLLGCLCEGGALCMDPFVRSRLSDDQIEKIKAEKNQAIQEQIEKFRKGRELPNLHNRHVILVDDGIVTGSTMIASWKMIQEQKPGRMIAALPVASYWMSLKMEELFDEVVTLEISDQLTELSDVYEKYMPVSQDTVKNLFDINSAILKMRHSPYYL
jgi:predicted phosphoribosyltransferase